MKQIKILIYNASLKKANFILFDEIKNNGRKHKVECTVYIQTKTSWQKVEYKNLINQIAIYPFVVNVIKSTNNRQLNFFSVNAFKKTPAEPCLTINKKPRPKRRVKELYCPTELSYEDYSYEYVTKWDSKKWNIADTGEQFLLAHCEMLIEVAIAAKQKFEIYFNVNENIKTTHIDFAKPWPTLYNPTP